jgi:hypothetical protein
MPCRGCGRKSNHTAVLLPQPVDGAFFNPSAEMVEDGSLYRGLSSSRASAVPIASPLRVSSRIVSGPLEREFPREWSPPVLLQKLDVPATPVKKQMDTRCGRDQRGIEGSSSLRDMKSEQYHECQDE